MENVINKKYESSFTEIVNFLSFLKASSWTYPTLYTYKYFQWKIENNPFGKNFSYLRFVDNVPAAHTSIISKPLNENLNLGIACGELGDSHTHPNFQKQGHFGEVGSKVISEFSEYNHGKALIYGIPNENAVRGWQTRCNCELMDDMGFQEYIFINLNKISFSFEKKISELVNPFWIEKIVDDLWQITYKNSLSLIKKDSRWWNWRYYKSTEKFRFFVLTSDEGKHHAYLIAKFSRQFIYYNIDICDIIGINEASEIQILESFLKKFSKPFRKFRIWSKMNSLQAEFLHKYKFILQRKINIIIFKNLSLTKFNENQTKLEIALGDTDNV